MAETNEEMPRPPSLSDEDAVVKVKKSNVFETNEADVRRVAEEVINGEWGEGDDLRARLLQAGYDHREIKREVIRISRGG